ncbi:glycosyltransferase family 2 protein [bacterium]|nr:glycosyltransferase family 2 protein [bacterium]
MLSIVVPVHNEAEALPEFLPELLSVAASLDPCEVILVDDGSTDGSLSDFTPPPRCRVLHHRRRRGYGAAVRSVVAAAKGDCIAILDAELTYHPADLVPLWEARAEADMLVGARPAATDSAARGLAKTCLRLLAQYLSGEKIDDLNSGLRLMRASVLRSFAHLLPSGFSLTTTVTLAFLCNGYDVAYRPIQYRPRVGKSKIAAGRDPGRFLMLIVRTILLFNPLKILGPLSLVLFALAAAVLIISKFVLHTQIPDITVSVLVLLSVQTLLLGLLADLLARRTRIDPPA